ncbi:hypothetical protein [Anaerobranca gottschalkii]|uniref:HlyD family secretion protein n=1 Tax=Anaerobranca gottschalkii DSM 13577 TaxID=1120990 RepID=A0A1H9ZZ99_9FIRM|nr:hypothetical protein [Anaerobranca gottschalkii]SES86237.1 hypothetical protein SAMN03080614_101422 [Anaerobranca gottschalkii DSM 13577]
MKKVAIIIGIMAVIMPVILITYITYLEMENYKTNVDFNITEKSYGSPSLIFRKDLEETVVIRGIITSNTFKFVEWNNNTRVRLLVSVGQEVKKGDILLTFSNGNVTSPVNGLIEEINVFDNYIKIKSFEELILEGFLPQRDVKKLEEGKEYQVDSKKLKLQFISNMIAENGVDRQVSFKIEGENLLYGQRVEIEIPTGTVYNNVLVISRKCVYQKEKGGPYFIRRVEGNGTVIGEVEVKIGIGNKDYISITGVEEGWFADPGYAEIMNVNMENQR